jgi:predicted dehydrogenase
MAQKVRWGILGLGGIAHRVMQGIGEAKNTEVAAVASRSQTKADSFAKKYGIPRSYGSYEGVVEDPQVDLVYVALPNHLHKVWTLRAAQAGKHVLCEKPFGMNAKEAQEMIAAAKKHKVFLMEAFMYRCHPQIAKLKELLKSKVIGEVRLIQSSFSFGGIHEDNCRMMLGQGGGGLMDVGCYPVSLIRLIAGQEPSECRATAVIGSKSRVDHWAAGTLKFPSGLIAHFDCGMMVTTDWATTIYGTKGRIKLPSPWVPGEKEASIVLTVYESGNTKVIPMPAKHIFSNEAEVVARNLKKGQAPEMTWKDTLGNMRTLDSLRASMGLFWPGEKRKSR